MRSFDELADDAELANSLARAGGRPVTYAVDAGGESFDQDDVWYCGEELGKMLRLLKPRIRNRRRNSTLLRRIEAYQDYLTSSSTLSDEDAAVQGTNALHIYRLTTAFKVLLGTGDAAQHSVLKELQSLFSEDVTTFETSEFNIVSAAMIQGRTSLPVTLINEGDDLSPDLRVGNLAYVECKDLHPASRGGLAKSLADHLSKAHDQLQSAQSKERLPGTGVCVDVPWGSLPLNETEWQSIRDALERPGGPSFILVSCSGARRSRESVSFPVLLTLATPRNLERDVRRNLVRHLCLRSYRIADTGFDVIHHRCWDCVRAFFERLVR